MTQENQNQPREFDAVLGGQAPPPTDGVVLGGIEGVKHRLKSSDVEVQITALTEALNYGEAGLDLVIDTLERSTDKVQQFAAQLLRASSDYRAKQMLFDIAPWLGFTKINDWSVQEFNPEVRITDPIGTSYAINLQLDWTKLRAKARSSIKSSPSKLPYAEEHQRFMIEVQRLDREEATKKFQAFLYTPHLYRLQTLHCHYPSPGFVDVFVEAKDRLTNLTALFWGDPDDNAYKVSQHLITINMSLVLEAYPKLEVLHLRGDAFGDAYYSLGSCLTFTPIRHARLKTLIIETRYLPTSTVEQIANLDLPNLEYLELWFGNAELDSDRFIPKIYEQFPELKYLGIRSCENADEVAKSLSNSPLIERLKILDLSMGTMTDEGLKYLLNCPTVNQLHTLNISMNYIYDTARTSQLRCQVIAQPQDSDYGDRYNALYE